MINIAIDGPAGAGKSTVAKALSKKLGILYLDTGAMYRACALKALKEGVNCKDEPGVARLVENIDISVKYIDGAQRTYLDGEDVSSEIRKPEISMMASDISALKCVRNKMVEMQREIASSNDCVLDGRDIGTFVLPNADYKFYVTADSRERAKRRYLELKQKGEEVELDALQKEIELRDENDRNRDFAPLRQAEDSIFTDTTSMTAEEVVDFIYKRIKKER